LDGLRRARHLKEVFKVTKSRSKFSPAVDCLSRMTPAAEKFRHQLQKELGITIGPKDPLVALWLAQQELLEELANQKRVAEFEAVLGRNQTAWTDQAKNIAQQSLFAARLSSNESLQSSQFTLALD